MPSPPITVSLAPSTPRNIASLPAPPVMRSAPPPSNRKSSPALPMIVSAKSDPSAETIPVSVSVPMPVPLDDSPMLVTRP